MKFLKLSLAACVATMAVSSLSATPLEEALKDVDLSGVVRYRYDTGRVDGSGFANRIAIKGKQDHNFRAQVNFKASIADNFKAFVQLEYNNTDGGYSANNVSSTKGTVNVRQLYLEYNNADYATSIIAGKHQLNTIWSDNGIDGLVGTGVKITNNSIEGLSLAAFVVDSFNANYTLIPANGGSRVEGGETDVYDWMDVASPWTSNLYGASAIGSFDVLGGTLNPQLWLAYSNNFAFLYALDLAYNTNFGNVNWGLEAAYLGNSLDSEHKDVWANIHGANNHGNGNFYALKTSLAGYGWDGSLGGLYYGDKDDFTFTVLEDNGNVNHLFAGEELKYTAGSHLTGNQGRNVFGYVTLGYTFADAVRLGGDFVYGTTTVGSAAGDDDKDKYEIVARVDYKYSPKLSFQAWYSYVNVDGQTEAQSGSKDTVRLQALYQF